MLPATAPVVIIEKDLGGIVHDYMKMIASYKRYHVHVIIRGPCASACTLLLGLKDTCVEPTAIFGFHQAFYQHPEDPGNPTDRAPLETSYLMSQYPVKLKQVINRNGGLGPTLMVLSGELMERTLKMCKPK